MDKQQIDYYNAWDEPIPYKGLLFYPIMVEKYIDFNIASNCIIINKNEIPNTKIISMNYLDFIFWYSTQSEQHKVFIIFLTALLKMCLHLKDEEVKYEIDNKGKYKILLPVEYIKIDNDKKEKIIKYDSFNGKDFDEFSKIICGQNGIELDENDTTHPEVKKALKEAIEFKNKNRKKMCSFNFNHRSPFCANRDALIALQRKEKNIH